MPCGQGSVIEVAAWPALYARPPVSDPERPTELPAPGPVAPDPDGEAPPRPSAAEPVVPEPPVAPEPVTPEPVTPEAVAPEALTADEGVAEGAEADAAPAVYPPVVAVLVTSNPGNWLEPALESIGAQDYPDLTVLVVDSGSDEDPTARIAAVLPRAYVRRLPSEQGFSEAANAVIGGVEGAPLVLFCHDDVVLDPGAVRVLVEEAYRSNAGILGPKLVDPNDPEILLEVGRSIDRFGGYHTGIEPGELDQEQHDGVRDVFYVSSAVMLVRTDLFTELGGFDPSAFPGAEDLDLCWRARLLGARVIVAPDARASHRQAAAERARGDRRDYAATARRRVRVLLTCYTLPTLLWIVPTGIFFAVLEAIGLIATGRARRARSVVGAWFTNLRHVGDIRAARRRAQANRRIHDRDLRELQVGAVHRMREFFAHHLHGDQRFRNVGSASRTVLERVSAALRSRATIWFGVFFLVYLFGSRHLVSDGVPTFGTFAPWPSIGSLLDSYTSAWRFTGLGSDAAAPPVQLVMSAVGTVMFGSTAAARDFVVLAAIPAGGYGAYRVIRHFAGGAGAAIVGALAYAASPLPRNALANGRLGPLVLFAAFPFLFGATLRLSGFYGDAEGASRARRRGRVLLPVAAGTALAAAFYPAALVLTILAAAALVLAALFVGGRRASLTALRTSALASAIAVLLVFPWPLAYLGGSIDGGAVGFAFRPPLGLDDVLRLHVGPYGGGRGSWGLLVAAAAPLVFATGDRLVWATRGWMLAVLGWSATWIPARFASGSPTLAPEATLVLAAFGLALALGIAVSVLRDGMHRFHFGWRQPAAIIASIALVLPVLAFIGDTFDGRWKTPSTTWDSTLSFAATRAAAGEFRLLWIGDPAMLPLDPVTVDGALAYSLTRNGTGDARELLRAPTTDTDDLVREAIELATQRRTTRVGTVLAPMGVRYLAVPATLGPDEEIEPRNAVVTAPLRRALADQLDLVRLRTARGLVVYENLAWIPVRAVVPEGSGRVPMQADDPTIAALRSDVDRARPLRTGRRAPSGTVVLAERYDARWHAATDRGDLRHGEAFGWSNGYSLQRPAAVDLDFSGQWLRWALVAFQFGIWALAISRWRRTRGRRPAPATLEHEPKRVERMPRDGETLLLDDERDPG